MQVRNIMPQQKIVVLAPSLSGEKTYNLVDFHPRKIIFCVVWWVGRVFRTNINLYLTVHESTEDGMYFTQNIYGIKFAVFEDFLAFLRASWKRASKFIFLLFFPKEPTKILILDGFAIHRINYNVDSNTTLHMNLLNQMIF